MRIKVLRHCANSDYHCEIIDMPNVTAFIPSSCVHVDLSALDRVPENLIGTIVDVDDLQPYLCIAVNPRIIEEAAP